MLVELGLFVLGFASLSLLPGLLMHTAFNWANGVFLVLESDPASLTLLILLAAMTVGVVAYWGSSTHHGPAHGPIPPSDRCILSSTGIYSPDNLLARRTDIRL